MTDEKSRADKAMDRYLSQEKPRLRSSQAPGQPKKVFDAPAASAPAPAAPPPPPPPPQESVRTVERVVHVGPSFWTIVWAVIVAQLLGGVVAISLWSLIVEPAIDDDLECATENVERVMDGLPEIYCP